MSFVLMKGLFTPGLGNPDGDSMRFVPDDPTPIFGLRRRGVPPKINPVNGSIQLRYEGIDTLEKKAIAPFSSDATRSNLDLAGTNNGTANARGHILSNQIDPNGRPIVFAFGGESDLDDGSMVFADEETIASSINAEQLRLGHAYPMFYDTLYRDLRTFMSSLAITARNAGIGVWKADATTTGFQWNPNVSLLPPIFPKLWRRIDTYIRDDTFFDPGNAPANLAAYVASLGEERVLLLNEGKFTGFDNLIEVSNGKVRLLAEPHDMVVVSEK